MNQMWTRSQNGILAGVCKGVSLRFDVDAMLVRLAWIFAVLFFGVGLCAYIFMAISLPREDKVAQAYESRIFGVCSRFALRFDLDVGLTRLTFLTLLFVSGGIVFLVYTVLYFTLPKSADLRIKNRICL